MQRLLVCATCCVGLVAGAVSAASSGGLETAQAPTREAGPPRVVVVCGMTMIPMDTEVRPEIAVKPWRSEIRADTRYTIKAIEPPICH